MLIYCTTCEVSQEMCKLLKHQVQIPSSKHSSLYSFVQYDDGFTNLNGKEKKFYSLNYFVTILRSFKICCLIPRLLYIFSVFIVIIEYILIISFIFHVKY